MRSQSHCESLWVINIPSRVGAAKPSRNETNDDRCAYGAPPPKSRVSGVKLTFRLNVVAPARLAKKRYASAQGCREKTSNPILNSLL